ncbi:MAG: arginine deiminase family protein [bacterium]|nr:arginine deiminase family protein [bacterium]
MKINSHNEWDTLREVVVGSAEHMTIGLEFPEGKTVSSEEFEKAATIAKKALPQWYQDEVAEDLQQLCDVITKFGATIFRPKAYGAERLVTTPNWSVSGRDLYNVRDLHIVVGDKVIASPTSARTRQYEPDSLYEIWYHYFKEGFIWITAPRPRLTGTYVVPYYKMGEELVTEEDILHRKLSGGRGETWHRLTEDEILFDAANIMRFGKDLIYLVSSTGNRKGAQWLQSILGNEYRVHPTATYRSSHLDSTILPLRPGLVLLNAARVNLGNCPELLKKWEAIYFNDMAPVSDHELNFQRDVRDKVYAELKTLGVESDLDGISSPWAGLNVLSLDQNTVLVHDRQTALIKELEKHKLTVIPIRLRNTCTIMGGLHCATLDTVRDSKLQSYFD